MHVGVTHRCWFVRHVRHWCVLGLLLPGLGTSTLALADNASQTPLKIDVVRDRLTLALTHYPQVYLHGWVDAGAPARFAAMVDSGRIAIGSDVYLNARGGDRAAGIALGRMFRSGRMATHLGTPRQPKTASVAAKTAECVDACAYAYLGGLYRWAPSGRDRIGFSAPPAQVAKEAPEVATYLEAMDIDLDALAVAEASAGDGALWMAADAMNDSGLANNGELPTTATYNLAPPAPTLELRQVDRKGTHRLSIQCQRGKTTVTAYDEVGVERARQIVSRGTRSYFELGNKEVLNQPHDGAQVADNAVMIRRDYPPADLVDLVSAWSFGAWVGGRSDAFRDGFTMALHPVHPQLKVFYYACWDAAPWPPRNKPRGK